LTTGRVGWRWIGRHRSKRSPDLLLTQERMRVASPAVTVMQETWARLSEYLGRFKYWESEVLAV
jgi:hypothetical protein